MNILQRKFIANALIMSQFSYWPFNLDVSSRAIEHRINRIHERILRLIYPNQHQLTFKELLEKNKTVSIRQRNLQTLANEIYNAKKKVSPEVANSLLEFTKKTTILEIHQFLKRKRCFTLHYGSESLLSLALKILELVTDSVREVKTSIFKNKIIAWTTDKCPCRHCINYIGKCGFI